MGSTDAEEYFRKAAETFTPEERRYGENRETHVKEQEADYRRLLRRIKREDATGEKHRGERSGAFDAAIYGHALQALRVSNISNLVDSVSMTVMENGGVELRGWGSEIALVDAVITWAKQDYLDHPNYIGITQDGKVASEMVLPRLTICINDQVSYLSYLQKRLSEGLLRRLRRRIF